MKDEQIHRKAWLLNKGRILSLIKIISIDDIFLTDRIFFYRLRSPERKYDGKNTFSNFQKKGNCLTTGVDRTKGMKLDSLNNSRIKTCLSHIRSFNMRERERAVGVLEELGSDFFLKSYNTIVFI